MLPGKGELGNREPEHEKGKGKGRQQHYVEGRVALHFNLNHPTAARCMDITGRMFKVNYPHVTEIAPSLTPSPTTRRVWRNAFTDTQHNPS